MDLHLAPLEPCDCRRLTVLRQDGVPTCHRCQKAKHEFAQTWIGQEPPVFKMDEIVRVAKQRVAEGSGRGSWTFSCEEITEAWNHDQELKRAMETMRYDDWRRLHPHITKQELTSRE